jgi:hypothetical protein
MGNKKMWEDSGVGGRADQQGKECSWREKRGGRVAE